MKKLFIPLLLVLVCTSCSSLNLTSITANDTLIRYEGRIDFSDSKAPYFSYQGISIKCKFRGTTIKVNFEDLARGGEQHTNYFTVIVDGEVKDPLPLKSGKHTYEVVSGLEDSVHTIELIKRTETTVGSTIFRGFLIDGDKLLELPSVPDRFIEFIGDSWMTGYGNEVVKQNQPNTGFHSINENYYAAWPALLAREFQTQHYCTAISGRGMFRNSNGTTVGAMPNVYDRISPSQDSPKWGFQIHQVDLVIIKLGTNDFYPQSLEVPDMLDSAKYVGAYVKFLHTVRTKYPKAKIVCVFGSSMSDWWPVGLSHLTHWRSYIQGIIDYLKANGEVNVYQKELTTQRSPYGEDWHPSKKTHQDIAEQMTPFIKNLMNW